MQRVRGRRSTEPNDAHGNENRDKQVRPISYHNVLHPFLSQRGKPMLTILNPCCWFCGGGALRTRLIAREHGERAIAPR